MENLGSFPRETDEGKKDESHPYRNFEKYRHDTMKYIKTNTHISAQDVRERIEKICSNELIDKFAELLKSDEIFLDFFKNHYEEAL